LHFGHNGRCCDARRQESNEVSDGWAVIPLNEAFAFPNPLSRTGSILIRSDEEQPDGPLSHANLAD